MKAHAEGPPNTALLFPVSKQHGKACQHTNCKQNLISGDREGSQRLPHTHGCSAQAHAMALAVQPWKANHSCWPHCVRIWRLMLKIKISWLRKEKKKKKSTS